jgi:hypothetical protein
METHIIWIYDGQTIDTDIIDYGSLETIPYPGVVQSFLAEQGYMVESPDPEANRLIVHPPLSPKHVEAFGRFCVKNHVDSLYSYSPASLRTTGITVIDRRKKQLLHGLGRQVVRY